MTWVSVKREWYFSPVPQLHETLPGLLLGVSLLLTFAAQVFGTTFTAAEFSTGAMSNWLTFEPRRLRVYASKVVAAAIGVVPVVMVVLGVVIGGAWGHRERPRLPAARRRVASDDGGLRRG